MLNKGKPQSIDDPLRSLRGLPLSQRILKTN